MEKCDGCFLVYLFFRVSVIKQVVTKLVWCDSFKNALLPFVNVF